MSNLRQSGKQTAKKNIIYYTRNVLDMDCETQVRLKLITLVRSVINSNTLIGTPSYFCW
jgi:hypothetical protein